MWLAAGIYLTSMYQRRLKEEKKNMSTQSQALGLPTLGIFTYISMSLKYTYTIHTSYTYPGQQHIIDLHRSTKHNITRSTTQYMTFVNLITP